MLYNILYFIRIYNNAINNIRKRIKNRFLTNQLDIDRKNTYLAFIIF